MADNTQAIMLEILKRIQADVSGLKTSVGGLEANVGGLQADVADIRMRVERLEDQGKRNRRDSAGMLVMTRSVVGQFDEHWRDVENDVRVLMEQDP